MKVDQLKRSYKELLSIELRSYQKSAIDVLLENAERLKPKPLLVRLPTGYGKTLIGQSLLAYGAAANDWSFARGLTYVLPTRALTHDVAVRLSEHLRKFNIESVEEFHSESDATDFYADVSVATFDTFLYAFARRTHDYHLERPAGVIATSYVVFDEAHMIQDEYLYSHSIMSKLVASLYEAGVPLVVMTATLPERIENVIFKHVRDPIRIPGSVDDFKEVITSYRGTLRDLVFRKDEDLLEYLESKEFYEKLRNTGRTLVVANTVGRAIKAFEVIKKRAPSDSEVILLHSRVRVQDRRDREKLARKLLQPEITCGKCSKKVSLPVFKVDQEVFCNECKPQNARQISSVILVATQVVEAGLDISCELLVTEGAPADALVQRVGRCARRVREEGTCVILKPVNPRPYPSVLVEETLRLLEGMKDSERINAVTELSSSYRFVNDSYKRFEPEEFPNALKELRSSMETTLRYLEGIHPFIVDQEAIRTVRARPNTSAFIFAPMPNEKIKAIQMVREGEKERSRYKFKEEDEMVIEDLINRASELSSKEAFFIDEETVRNRLFTLETIRLINLIKDERYRGALLFLIHNKRFIASLFYTRTSLLDVSVDRKARYYKLELIEYKESKRVIIEEGTYVLNPSFYHPEYGFHVWWNNVEV